MTTDEQKRFDELQAALYRARGVMMGAAECEECWRNDEGSEVLKCREALRTHAAKVREFVGELTPGARELVCK